MALVLTNTLSGRKEPLGARQAGECRIYWCGLTVYSRSHVGHARAMVVADFLHRHLRATGTRVQFVRNVTDVDDKIIRRAATEGITPMALAEREARLFAEDLAPLACLPPNEEPRATQHIPQMLALIETLIHKGFAYPVAGGSVYFRVRRFAEYGKLSHRRLEDMEQGEEIDAGKEDSHDFALWKGAKPGEPIWDSPWGGGRPGWHLECSAMASHYLGQPFDIHGGGTDLVFPHHENEIAQSEAAAGVPLADLWMHNGMITLGGDKMSKSVGNLMTVADVTSRMPGEALRFLFLGTHYRSPLEFSAERLEEAARSLERLYESLARAEQLVGPIPAVAIDGALLGTRSWFVTDFVGAMDDDLNTARALGIVHDRFRELNRACDAGDHATVAAARDDLVRAGSTFGVFGTPPAAFLDALRARGQERTGLSTAEIEEAIAARNQARSRKDFSAADAIRERLKNLGILLEDTPSGTVWRAG